MGCWKPALSSPTRIINLLFSIFLTSYNVDNRLIQVPFFPFPDTQKEKQNQGDFNAKQQ